MNEFFGCNVVEKDKLAKGKRQNAPTWRKLFEKVKGQQKEISIVPEPDTAMNSTPHSLDDSPRTINIIEMLQRNEYEKE